MNTDDPYLIKVVRDRVDEAMVNKRHEILFVRIQDTAEAIEGLRRKLGEEAVEYLLKPGIGELADILDSIEALAEVDLGVSMTDVEIEAEKKRMARGDFRTVTGMYAVPIKEAV